MSFFKNASIKSKIYTVLIPMAAIGIAGAAYVSYEYRHTANMFYSFVTKDTVASSDMFRSVTSLLNAPYTGYQYAFADETANREEFRATYEDAKKTLFERLDEAAQLTPEDASEINVFKQRAVEIFAILDKAFAALDRGQRPSAMALLAQSDAKVKQWRDDLRIWNNENLVALRNESNGLKQQADSTILMTLTGLALLFGLGLVGAQIVATRGINRPIAGLQRRMVSLAGGEVSEPIDGIDRKDEIGAMAKAVSVFRDNAVERLRLETEAAATRSLSEQERLAREAQKAQEAADIQFAVDHLAAALTRLSEGDVSHRIDHAFVSSLDGIRRSYNDSAAKLEDALMRVAENARVIDGGANEIRASADDLAKRTEQQAASVEETAAALEQITTAVKDSTRRAQEAGSLVAHTKAEAERSGEVVRRAVIAMQQIEKSSSEISSIISVIDEIAFQTNLLALNAGVEAARAGEAGKGFAVVAQEVRELAQRSASAAKDIKGLITTSNEHVQSGVALVGQTGEALTKISSEVVEINGHVSAIVEAAQEQSSGLQQINTAVNQMDQDTQKNAAMVEETNAASHSLAKESASLAQLLAQFRLSNSGRSPVQNVVVAAPATRSAAPQPVVSPARSLGRKVAAAFSGRAATAENWEEF